jgi:glycerol dehydrogenase
MNIARLCYDTVMEYGVAALKDVEANKVTDAVERCTEANVLMSGLGFESVGVATAHAVANALPSQPECRFLMHGEEVGFGVITQLCLDPNFDDAERNKIVDWEIAVGLPVTLAEVGLEGAPKDKLKAIADICIDSTLCNNHPFEVTSEKLVDAMIAADALGKARKKG